MTINDGAAPQDRDTFNGLSSHLDIADLVRALDERARIADDRAKAADDRSQALAERVALLESQLATSSAEKRPSYTPYEPELRIDERRPSLFSPYESERIIGESNANNVRLELGTGSIQGSFRDLDYKPQEEEAIPSVVGLAENNNHEREYMSLIQSRLDRIEDRLIDVEEETRGSFNNQEYILPESTFSLLVTEPPLSRPFMFAIFTAALSLTCLGLVLYDSVENGTEINPINVPAGNSNAVRAAQFVGILVGVLFEDECPQGLQHIAFGFGHKLLLDGSKKIHKRLVAVSLLRLAVGYMFLASLFLNVVQNSEVIGIFYDVLALEFVENIDDTAFALAKKGFLGQKLLVATVKRHVIEIPMGQTRKSVVMSRDLFGQKSVQNDALRSGTMISNSKSNNIARLIYYCNAIILLSALMYLSVMQSQGKFRCRRIDVSFSEEIWEKATIKGGEETKLLSYPYFNGIYEADGDADGHPKYIEQNKIDGNSFQYRNGAQIQYCEEIESWIFTHHDIETENECGWLFRSDQVDPETDFDVIAAARQPWTAWVGEAVFDAGVSIKCTTCVENSDCSYQGNCVKGRCECNSGRGGHFCEFEQPCYAIASEKADKLGSPGSPAEQWYHENPITLIGRVYDRPIYIQKNLTDIDPFDWRKFDVRQREPTSMPSIEPSAPTWNPTYQASFQPTTIVGTATGGGPLEGIYELSPTIVPSNYPGPKQQSKPPSSAFPTLIQYDPGDYEYDYSSISAPPTKPWYTSNEYETDVEDFAEHDDFFEAKPLHDLDEIMKNYSVVMRFTGSRFYATIIEPDATFDDLIPPDYHAFWDDAFDVNRTFVISDKTDRGTPVGVDFFEMRRRVPSDLNENVNFKYGPYGALIPNMNYENAGFFHCLNGTV